MPTLITGLAGVCRVDCEQLATSLFRFVRQLLKELTPCCISKTLCQTMVMHHAIDVHVFHADGAVLSNDAMAVLMGEIGTPELDAFMHTGDRFAMLAPFRRPFRTFGLRALNPGQCFFFFPEETRVLNVRSIGQCRKGVEPHVHADPRGIVRQAFGIVFDRERCVPLASRGTMDRERVDLALNWSVIHEPDTPDLGEAHAVIMRQEKPRLRIGETIVAALAFETRIPRVFALLDPSKEPLKSKLYTLVDVLQDL